MGEFDSINEKIKDLRRDISLLEWDMPNIKNEVMRGRKERKLKECKEELHKLLELRSSNI